MLVPLLEDSKSFFKSLAIIEDYRKFCFIMLSNFLLFFYRLNEGKNKRDEPKGIVFLSNLLLLFQHCHHCFCPNPHVKTIRCGTMLTIESRCNNCKECFTWKSQPYLFGKSPAGIFSLVLVFCVQELPSERQGNVCLNMPFALFNGHRSCLC